MKKFIIFLSLFFASCNAYAIKPVKKSAATKDKEAIECSKKMESFNSDQKIDCLFKITKYLDRRNAELETEIADLSLATTGY